MTYDSISQMLAELGPKLDAMEIAAFEEQQSWAIALDDDHRELLALDYDGPSAKLYITADLGAPPDGMLRSTYDFLLQYNACWAETGGVRLALDGPGGDVLQIFDVSLHDLHRETLGDVIVNFIALMRVMRGIVARGAGEDEDKPAPRSLHMNEEMIPA